MGISLVKNEDLAKISPEDICKALETSSEGLSSQEAQARLEQFGPNALEEKKVSPFKKFFMYLWGPIPWMIEIAVILSLIVQNWADAIVIFLLLVVNTVIGFWQESKAQSALDALKAGLAPQANVKRDGEFRKIAASELVPGDIIHIRLGDILPADCKLMHGEYLTVDQAVLTGESLPVTRQVGDLVYSGSVAKQGEMDAVVASTGVNTFFGRTAKLVSDAGAKSHFQEAILRIGNFLIISALILAIILVAIELFRYGATPQGITGKDIGSLAILILTLVVASIPVAMPAVLSITMALGALELSKHKAIVSKLQAIEEIAGIDILCSDKTGTLTKNKLTLNIPFIVDGVTKDEVILNAALASNGVSNDVIDDTIIAAVKDKDLFASFKQTKFVPFDPVSKRTVAELTDAQGNTFTTSKGAPQVVMDLCHLSGDMLKAAQDSVSAFAKRGFRTLGVAKTLPDGTWKYLGTIPMYDPPRDDSAQTIKEANEHGVKVKMVTGDDTAIAIDTSDQLGLDTNILPAADVFKEDESNPAKLAQEIEKAGGFSRVFPQHKHGIVKSLQERGHIVGMTGDGVNDAPALKQADAGIAVSGATDAARAAAAIILTEPGLHVIISAIEAARRIFARMMSYTVYRITMTFTLMIFVVLSMIIFPSVGGKAFIPLTAIMIILLALLNDIPIMTIAYDNAEISPTPVRWNMKQTLTVSTVLGLFSVVQTLGFLVYIVYNLNSPLWGIILRPGYIQTMIFLQLIISGRLMLFLARQPHAFFKKPFPAWQLLLALIGTQIFAELITGFGWSGIQMAAVPWTLHGFIWVYNIIWMIILDIIKNIVYAIFGSKKKVDPQQATALKA